MPVKPLKKGAISFLASSGHATASMYVKAAIYTQRFRVSPNTLRRWADSGRINFRWSPGGIRLYELPAEDDDGPLERVEKDKVIYARVSSSKQKDDLKRQADFLAAKFPGHRLVTDVGSGINWKRKGLLSLLDAADDGALEEVVVASRDRLCRFAFDLLDHVFRRRGVRLVVLDAGAASAEQELSDDLLSIVQIFCCRRNGKRRYSACAAVPTTGGAGDGAADAEDQAEPHPAAAADAEPLRGSRQVHV